MNQPSIINRDIKSHTPATGSRPQHLRLGYLLLAGLTTLMAVALLSGNSEPARAIQSVSLPLDEQETTIEALRLPQADTLETVAIPELAPNASMIDAAPAKADHQASAMLEVPAATGTK